MAEAQLLEYLFQFTPLREGRHMSAVTLVLDEVFQFTPLREGRHGLAVASRAD